LALFESTALLENPFLTSIQVSPELRPVDPGPQIQTVIGTELFVEQWKKTNVVKQISKLAKTSS